MADQTPAEPVPGSPPSSTDAAKENLKVEPITPPRASLSPEPQEQQTDTSMTFDGTNDSQQATEVTASGGTAGAAQTDVQTAPPQAETEARIPQKKDATLREFLGKMDDYAPIIPDAVTAHYLTLAGLPPPPATPPHLARLLALATQKFVADIAADAYQYARIRSSHTTSNTNSAAAMMGAGLGLPGQPAGSQGAAAAGVSKDAAGAKGNLGLGVQRAGFGGGGQGGGQGRTVLTMEDLGMAVGEYGVNVRRGEFYR